MFRDHGGLTGQREPAPVGVPWACRVRHASSGSRCATRLAPSRWTGTSIVMIKMSVGPPSIDLPPCSEFYGKPLQAWQIKAGIRRMIGHARGAL